MVLEVELKVLPRVEELFRELKVFERNRKPFEVKVFAWQITWRSRLTGPQPGR